VSAPVWVILPTYDEAATLEPVVRRVLAAVPGAHVLVVDDASPDGTGAIAERLAAEHTGVEVLHRASKAGLGSACLAGFAHALRAGAERVIQMDADLSHDPADLPRLLASDAALAIGSRYVPRGGVEGWGAVRRTVSRAGCAYARRVLGAPVRDLTSGIRCWRADALAAVVPADLRSQGYAFQVELAYRTLLRGLSVEEIPIVFRGREHGRSKMSARIALEAAWVVPALRFARDLPTN
jgi:dolichol-phosphate mannosyltransferase